MATLIDTMFEHIAVETLHAMPIDVRDALSFGVIGFDRETIVHVYNAAESRLAGLSPERILGQPLFAAVAQCMNNYLVAQRFEDEALLDEIVPFVLTLRMRPTPVRLRLLASPDVPLRYILIER